MHACVSERPRGAQSYDHGVIYVTEMSLVESLR